jgi:hypothetical protein
LIDSFSLVLGSSSFRISSSLEFDIEYEATKKNTFFFVQQSIPRADSSGWHPADRMNGEQTHKSAAKIPETHARAECRGRETETGAPRAVRRALILPVSSRHDRPYQRSAQRGKTYPRPGVSDSRIRVSEDSDVLRPQAYMSR